MANAIGTVSELWRFPVKSMGGERLDQAEVGERGLRGDRAYGIIEADTGKVASAKSVRRFPDLLRCRAAFVEPPVATRELPAVRIEFPDGASVTSDARDVDARLSAHFGHAVRLARVAPDDFTIDQYQPDLEGGRSGGTVIQQPLGAALFAAIGQPAPLPPGTFFDVYPLSLLTTATLQRLQALCPTSRFEVARFRMNVIVDTPAEGFVENDWPGRDVALGAQVRCQITLPDPRCVMTTLPQDGLDSDADVLRTLLAHNRIDVGAFGKLPCAGVYAAVATSGTVRVGDPVRM